MEPRNRTSRAFGALKGFTLAEILVVVLLLGIAAAVVVPNISDTSDVQAVSAARMIATDLQYAQNTAITGQKNIKMVFDVSGNFYRVANDDSQSTSLVNPINKGEYKTDFDTASGFGRLKIVSTTFPGSIVKFDVTGAPDNPGSVRVQSGSRIYVVSVAAATGRVTVAPG